MNCWLAIGGVDNDITVIQSNHPNGKGIILYYAGKDGTEALHKYHSISIFSNIDSASSSGTFFLGAEDKALVPIVEKKASVSISRIIPTYHFGRNARRSSDEAWEYLLFRADDKSTCPERRVWRD
jgi:hypothetical protein